MENFSEFHEGDQIYVFTEVKAKPTISFQELSTLLPRGSLDMFSNI